MSDVVERVAVVVVHEVLEQRAADALHDAARDLAFDDARVDHRAAVLAHDVAEQLDPAGLEVDLAGAHVRGVHPDRRGCPRCSARLLRVPAGTPGGNAWGWKYGELGDLGEARCRSWACPRTLARLPASSMSSAAASRLVRGDGADPVAQNRRGLAHRAGGHRPAAAPAGAGAEAGQCGVALDRVDVVDVRAERVGGELHDRGLEAVPGRPARDVHVDRARRLDADRRGFRAASCRIRGSTARRRSRCRRRGSGRWCAPPPAPCGTRRSRGSRAPAPTSRAARCCRRSCRWGWGTAGRRARSRLRRRSSAGSMPISPRRDVEQHLAGERLELPRAAIRAAADGVGVDRLGGEAGLGHAVRAGEEACRPRPPGRPATVWGTRRSPGTKSMYAAWITPSASNAIAHVAVFLPGLARREQVLAPVLDPLQRRPDLRRRRASCTSRRAAPSPSGRSRRRCRASRRGPSCSGTPSRREQNSAHLVRHLGRGVDRDARRSPGRSRRRARVLRAAPATYACW